MFFSKRSSYLCLAIVALLLCATLLITTMDTDDASLSDAMVIPVTASSDTTGPGDFSELVSGGANESNWFPIIAMDGDGDVHVVWYELDFSSGFKASILYRMKSGDSWMPIETVMEDIGGMFVKPSMALDPSGNVHVTWESDRNLSGSGTDKDIYYKARTQGEWTATELVSAESNESSSNPSIAVDGDGNVHIAWTDASGIPGTEGRDSVFYKMKTALGWTSTRVIQSDAGSECKNAKLVVDAQGNVHITWIEIVVEDWVNHIKHRMKQSGHWGDVQTVRQSDIEIGDFNGILMGLESTGRLHLIWSEQDWQNNLDDPFTNKYHSMMDEGVWSTPELIPVGIYDVGPAFAIDRDDRLHLVITGVPSDYEPDAQPAPIMNNIGYITYHGGFWSEYGFVDLDRMEERIITSIAVDDGRNVHLVWMDIPPGGGMVIDIRYAMIDNSALYAPSPDGGTAVAVFVVFVAGLFVVSFVAMRLKG